MIPMRRKELNVIFRNEDCTLLKGMQCIYCYHYSNNEIAMFTLYLYP